MEPVAPKRPTITVQYKTQRGQPATAVREVYFVRGFGHYIKWRRRTILVEPLQTIVVIA